MDVVIDTSVLLAVIANEPHKQKIIDLTKRAQLIAPSSIHWEIGNAFSAMFKRDRITFAQAAAALAAYNRITIRLSDPDIAVALDLAYRLKIYAYDAYIIPCAQKHDCPLITLDKGLRNAARQLGISTLEIIR